MAQTGYTPISLYYSTTASAAPTAGNLANGELAVNIADGNLFYKNSGGVVNLFNNPRVSSTASASSLTPNVDAFDQYAFTALAADLTINAPTGSVVDGKKLLIRILDNGTPRALSWNGTYTVIGVTLPTSTVASKTIYVGCIYNANNTRWDVVGVVTQA